MKSQMKFLMAYGVIVLYVLTVPKCRGSPRCSWQRRALSLCSGWPLSWAPQESSWTALQKRRKKEREGKVESERSLLLLNAHSASSWYKKTIAFQLSPISSSQLYSISVKGRNRKCVKKEMESWGRIRRGIFRSNKVWLLVHRRSDKNRNDSMENSPAGERER